MTFSLPALSPLFTLHDPVHDAPTLRNLNARSGVSLVQNLTTVEKRGQETAMPKLTEIDKRTAAITRDPRWQSIVTREND
jgi:hypothetical protein